MDYIDSQINECIYNRKYYSLLMYQLIRYEYGNTLFYNIGDISSMTTPIINIKLYSKGGTEYNISSSFINIENGINDSVDQIYTTMSNKACKTFIMAAYIIPRKYTTVQFDTLDIDVLCKMKLEYYKQFLSHQDFTFKGLKECMWYCGIQKLCPSPSVVLDNLYELLIVYYKVHDIVFKEGKIANDLSIFVDDENKNKNENVFKFKIKSMIHRLYSGDKFLSTNHSRSISLIEFNVIVNSLCLPNKNKHPNEALLLYYILLVDCLIRI